MAVSKPLITMTFLRRLLALLLVIGVLKGVLAVSGIVSPPWIFLVDLFLLGAVVLHKWSVPIQWLYGSGHSPLNRFLRSAVVYFVPAGILWGLLSAEFFQHYLPQAAHVPAPIPELVMLGGIYAVAQTLLGTEILRLRRPKQ